MYYILYLEALSGGPSWVFSINQSYSTISYQFNNNSQLLICAADQLEFAA